MSNGDEKGGMKVYENYSRQALPTRKYRELLGSAISVFNSNNSFIIENILSQDIDSRYDWYSLIDRTSGRLVEPIKETITKNSDANISEKFEGLVTMRNRIVHSFQVTGENGEQILATKTKDDRQFIITEEYLYDFIKKNEDLSTLLHKFRGY